MVSSRNITRYWATTAIIICVLYWTFRISRQDVMPVRTKSPKIGGVVEASRNRTDMDADHGHHLAEALRTAFVPSHPFPSKFPRIVWQTANEQGREKFADKAETWKKVQGFQYNFLSDEGADDFVHDNFASRPSIVNFWDSLTQPVLRADLLRYLILLGVGGVYGDIDTSMIVHPDRWIPIDLGANTVNAIIGIEYDDTTYQLFIRPISFCQWTMMAKPGHPIFDVAVQRVMSNLEFVARRRKVTMDNLTLDKGEVLAATGPGLITDVVMQVLNDQGHNVTWETFHGQKEPRLFGDVLILPINGFASGQKHSHSGDRAYGEVYVSHHFGRSWYYHPEPPPESDDNKGDEKKEDVKDDKKGDVKNVDVKDDKKDGEKKPGAKDDKKDDEKKPDVKDDKKELHNQPKGTA